MRQIIKTIVAIAIITKLSIRKTITISEMKMRKHGNKWKIMKIKEGDGELVKGGDGETGSQRKKREKWKTPEGC